MYNSKTTENNNRIYKTGEVERFYNLTLNSVVNEFRFQFFYLFFLFFYFFLFPPVHCQDNVCSSDVMPDLTPY